MQRSIGDENPTLRLPLCMPVSRHGGNRTRLKHGISVLPKPFGFVAKELLYQSFLSSARGPNFVSASLDQSLGTLIVPGEGIEPSILCLKDRCPTMRLAGKNVKFLTIPRLSPLDHQSDHANDWGLQRRYQAIEAVFANSTVSLK